ncbi:MAG: GntR family transcriptional regulator [Oscillibacter sp.]|jgi:K+/H+ antiporter YhaU regulatory subunit KhtT|nr:GntR family transcriptional regulator [Oscillibacter sp.]
MNQTVVPTQYLQIALDLARRIASGELPEGSRVYGRSMMASEYNVSPETIRRALRLLADMRVVQVKPQSGAVVLSADSARRYIENFEESADIRSLRTQLKELMAEYTDLHRRMSETVNALVKRRDAFTAPGEPLPNYGVTVPKDSPCLGKSIGALKFWQSTGATIVAIRRGQTVILSPGPYAELYAGDVVILVGNSAAAEAACNLITAKEQWNDSISKCL